MATPSRFASETPGSFTTAATLPPLLPSNSCASTLQLRVDQMEASLESVKKLREQDQETTRSVLAWMRHEIDVREAMRSRVSAMESAFPDVQRVAETMDHFGRKFEELSNEKQRSSRQIMSFQYELTRLAMDQRHLETQMLNVANGLVGQAQAATAASSAALKPIAARLDTLEAELERCTSKGEFDILHSQVDRPSAEELRAVLSRLDDADRRLQAAEDVAAEYTKAKTANVEAAAGASLQDVAEMRNALAETCRGIALLAHDLALLREEHAVAIAKVGDVTEYVAKAAASSIDKSAELERAWRAERVQLAATADNILTQVFATTVRSTFKRLLRAAHG